MDEEIKRFSNEQRKKFSKPKKYITIYHKRLGERIFNPKYDGALSSWISNGWSMSPYSIK